ncbi:MAG: hypothetical protein R3B45_09190 [Bdellovibrionota bacterium]
MKKMNSLKLFYCILYACFSLTTFASEAKIEKNLELQKELFGSQSGKIKLAISLQWEGSQLEASNLEAIKLFRKKFASIDFFQFVNPAYFTKKDQDPQETAKKIKSAIYPEDSMGLQLLGWKSFIQDAKVIFRNSPTFWGNQLNDRSCLKDCGHEIPLSAYNKSEIRTLIDHSLYLFDKYDLPKPHAFMAGGWMASNDVLEAAVESGFKYDFSGVPPHLVKSRIAKYPLFHWITELWNQTTAFSQPVPVPTRAGWITEVFNNAATLDYLSTKDLIDLFDGYINLHRKYPNNNYVIHLGFYQETAAKTLPRLESALQHIFAVSNKKNISLSMLKLLPPTSNKGSSDKNLDNDAFQKTNTVNWDDFFRPDRAVYSH